ncbi:MAG: hypothetical protein V3V03_04835 [Hyphomonadaceae bacterium]
MRKPKTMECLYLDFDGFFASVMQQAIPAIRGKPVGVIPFDTDAAYSTVVIACSKEAKALGCQNVMRVPEAMALCPDLVLVKQRPDLFMRAHNTLLNEIACEIPIDTVKSIDELTCTLDKRDIDDPRGLATRLQTRIATNVGPHITFSIGFAANRLLAKTACKMDKPNGVTIWQPEDMPAPLLSLPISEISGIGSRLERRLQKAGIYSMEELFATQPKQLRKIWGNVNGERMWYALQGYDIRAMPTGRGMYGHGRVLPPDWRDLDHAMACSRLLLTKAARRMRRDGWYAGKVDLWLDMYKGGWFGQRDLPIVNDDHTCLDALSVIWGQATREVPKSSRVIRVGVTLSKISQASSRQLDMLRNDDEDIKRWERLTSAMDHLNLKFGKRVLTIGPWVPPPGGHLGGKIAFTRIPSAEDFW